MVVVMVLVVAAVVMVLLVVVVLSLWVDRGLVAVVGAFRVCCMQIQGMLSP